MIYLSCQRKQNYCLFFSSALRAAVEQESAVQLPAPVLLLANRENVAELVPGVHVERRSGAVPAVGAIRRLPLAPLAALQCADHLALVVREVAEGGLCPPSIAFHRRRSKSFRISRRVAGGG